MITSNVSISASHGCYWDQLNKDTAHSKLQKVTEHILDKVFPSNAHRGTFSCSFVFRIPHAVLSGFNLP